MKVVFTGWTLKGLFQYYTNMRQFQKESEEALINRAVKKIWGKNCFWLVDIDLGLYYGNVCNSSKKDCRVTSRMSISFKY